MTDLVLQIAAYEERANLEILLPRLLALNSRPEVIVVVDASTDGTSEFLKSLQAQEPRLHPVIRERKLGYGSATLEGFQYAAEMGARRLVTLDADLSHDPEEIESLVGALDKADVVIGSRYCGGCRVLNWALHRLALSVLANTYVKTILRLPFSDCTSGFRAYRVDFLREHLRANLIRSDGYSVLVEILYRLVRRKARVVEVPIVFHERREGQSKMSRRVMFEAAWMPFWLWLKVGLPRRVKPPASTPQD